MFDRSARYGNFELFAVRLVPRLRPCLVAKLRQDFGKVFPRGEAHKTLRDVAAGMENPTYEIVRAPVGSIAVWV
jgi:hypothetical protein